MSIDREQVRAVVEAAGRAIGVREVLDRLGMHAGAQTAVKRVLRDLVRDGEVTKAGKRFTCAKPGTGGEVRGEAARPALLRPGAPAAPGRRGKTAVGVLRKRLPGYGFVSRIDRQGEDVYVSAAEGAQVFDGDLVRVEIVPAGGGRTAGRIVEVVERRRQFALGTYVARGKATWIQPSDPALGEIIRVAPTRAAKDGDIVKVRLLQPGRARLPPEGEVVAKAGEPGDPYLETLRAAFAQGFSDEFPQPVVDEAARVARPVREEDLEGRRDLRPLALVTIDGEDARDFDDAVFVERAPAGYRLVVAIADVSHYVRQGSALDDEALFRTTSVYFPNAVLPMLPEALSNDVCSLRPEEDRLCLVADMVIDTRGNPVEAEIYPGVMKSRARCTYTEVATLLGGEPVPHREFLRDPLTLAWELAQKLTHMRMERGAIDFDLPEAKVVLDERGGVRAIEKRERNPAHRLIEECMLAANEAVARHFALRGLPTIFRVHGEPDAEKLLAFAELAGAHGLAIPRGGLTPRALNQILQQVEDMPQQRAFNTLLLRAMMQATYDAENIGHYGLAAEHYLHFTSPIRRYPDLVVHRLLKASWGKGVRGRQEEAEVERLESIALRCSERERAAMLAEREVDAFFGCLYLKDKLGERFKGVVSSVTDFGFFVELEDAFVEGLVKAEELGSGFAFDPVAQTLTYGASGRSYSVGEKVEVLVRSVNLERRRIDLSLIEHGEVVKGPAVRGPRWFKPGAKKPGRPEGGPRGKPGRPGAKKPGGRRR